jgi:hypothetical protein
MALSKARDTKQKAIEMLTRVNELFPMNGGSEVFQGGLVALDAGGNLVPMSTATGLKCVGRAEESIDNSAGADGDLSCKVKPGCFRWANSAAGDAITKAEVGSVCYGVDDQTVAKTDGTGTRSAAGIVHSVDTDGVWVISGIPEVVIASGIALP